MSSFLAIDTSSRYLTVVACNGGETVVRYTEDCAMRHSVVLMDEIDAALKKAGLSPEQCDYFVAVTGPGSFTGIRIGISCIKGFAAALGKRAAGVTAFDMLSYNVNSDCDYLVAIDAAHGYYYVCGYNAEGEENLAPCYLSYGETEKLNRPVYGFEDLPFKDYVRLDAGKCLAPAAERLKEGDFPLSALYVRKSQAEEERAARSGENK